MDILKRLEGIVSLIGNTPLLKIDFLWKGQPRSIFAKAEYLNLTGSIKDRMAFHILKKAYRTGTLRPEAPIAEATSGNTGISFSALGRLMGHPVTIFMPQWMSQERKNLMRSYGAEIRLVSREEGGFLGSIAMAEQMAQENPVVFLPRQFDNEDNCEAHYMSTGPEIVAQLAKIQRIPDAFVAGVGTGGTVMGVGRYIRRFFPGAKIHPLEPSNSPTLTTGYKIGFHRIQGISDEFIPAILKLEQLDSVVQVEDGDAILMAQKLSRDLGLGVGISSGGNFLGALKLLNAMSDEEAKNATIVTVFVDDNKKYLSTD
ncbi:MAG: PLP-dependent cysteine synthase family protein, partial [Planctomycetia bacterium]|nr:PLP-dependent cysteine synthase family protein [Planctomycetia bacterium]